MGLKVGLLGVGPVGDRIIKVLRQRAFPADGEIKVMATSERDEVLASRTYHVEKIGADSFRGLDLVFFAGKEGAKGASLQWGEVALSSGCIVIDNGGDLRMRPEFPLVVPEINMDAVTRDTRYICNPNCSTIQMAVALYPLHKAARLRRAVVSTYQSVSGFGKAAMDELAREAAGVLSGEDPHNDPAVFPRPIGFCCIPQVDRFLSDGYTKEEAKLIHETRKVFSEPNLLISPTVVRVPVFVGHGESVNAEFDREMDREKAVAILSDPARAPGVTVLDGKNPDPAASSIRGDGNELRYPVTEDLKRPEYRDSVLVGRIRDDTAVRNGISFWCVSDNLRKGAATNAVQIAEEMIKRGLL